MQWVLDQSFVRRFLAVVLVIAGGWGLDARPACAQKADERQEKYEPVTRTLATRDELNLRITYYQSNRGKDAPVVVLLHMTDGNRMIWQGNEGFANRLQTDGYAVVAVDLRGHGDSKGDGAAAAATSKKSRGLRKGDYLAMVEFDMEAVNKFLFDEHQAGNLNMNKTAFIGPEMGATIAVYSAMRDWKKPKYADAPEGSGRETPRGENVRALVLISPQQNIQGLGMAPAMKFLGSPVLNLAFMVCVSERDSQDKGQARKTFDQVSSFPRSEERMYFKEYPGTARGTDLLGKRTKLEDNILAFLGKHLREPQIPWTDRRPADERN